MPWPSARCPNAPPALQPGSCTLPSKMVRLTTMCSLILWFCWKRRPSKNFGWVHAWCDLEVRLHCYAQTNCAASVHDEVRKSKQGASDHLNSPAVSELRLLQLIGLQLIHFSPGSSCTTDVHMFPAAVVYKKRGWLFPKR